MAARFVVAVAFIALCHSSPIDDREARSYSIGQGFASGYGGNNQATANVQGGLASATGTNNGGLSRDGFAYNQPGQAIANAQTSDDAQIAAIDLARVQGYYHPLPAAAPAFVPYSQNYAIPAELAPSSAKSVASTNGLGGSAISNALNSQGVSSTNARTQGSGSAASEATNGYGFAPIAPIAQYAPIVQVPAEPAIIAAKQVYYKPAPQRKSISWRFGTAYDIPAGYGSIKDASPVVYQPAIKTVTPVVYQPAPIAYEAIPADLAYGRGNADSSADTQGDSSAQSAANNNIGNSNANSKVTATGGSANAKANIYNGASGLYRSGAGNGNGHTDSHINGVGSANSDAQLLNGASFIKSSANTQQGTANSHSNINNGIYNGYYRNAEGAQLGWGKAATNVNTAGQGAADSIAQILPYKKVVSSNANSFGLGRADANSQSY